MNEKRRDKQYIIDKIEKTLSTAINILCIMIFCTGTCGLLYIACVGILHFAIFELLTLFSVCLLGMIFSVKMLQSNLYIKRRE